MAELGDGLDDLGFYSHQEKSYLSTNSGPPVETREPVVLLTISRRKINWIGHIWLRNCLLKDVIEGKRGRSDGKTRRKTSAATGQPQRKEKIL
jgi:hypothetical protein